LLRRKALRDRAVEALAPAGPAEGMVQGPVQARAARATVAVQVTQVMAMDKDMVRDQAVWEAD
jgi:hypothetical protein